MSIEFEQRMKLLCAIFPVLWIHMKALSSHWGKGLGLYTQVTKIDISHRAELLNFIFKSNISLQNCEYGRKWKRKGNERETESDIKIYWAHIQFLLIYGIHIFSRIVSLFIPRSRQSSRAKKNKSSPKRKKTVSTVTPNTQSDYSGHRRTTTDLSHALNYRQ